MRIEAPASPLKMPPALSRSSWCVSFSTARPYAWERGVAEAPCAITETVTTTPTTAKHELRTGHVGVDHEQGQEQGVQAAWAEPPDKRPRPVADGGFAEDDADGEGTGDEDHDQGEYEGRHQRHFAEEVAYDDAEQDKRQQHRHLARRLAVVQKALAQIEVQNREPRTRWRKAARKPSPPRAVAVA